MRSRAILTFIFTASLFALPVIAHAGGIPFFGPIIPQDANQNVCPASWGMLITVINNIISLLLTLAIVFVAPLSIAYAGFLYVVNPVDPSGISEAKGVLLHTVIGIVIALAGWLIVNAVMAVLYHPTDTTWGAWSDLITGNSNDLCLKQEGALPGDQLKQAAPGTGVTSAPLVGGALATDLSNSPGDPCNPATIMAASPTSASTANLLACIAKSESTCGTLRPPDNLNFNWNKDSGNGEASTAAGAYQVLLASNHACYEKKPCYQAVGLPADGGTKLNCNTGFDSKGFLLTTPLGISVVERCRRAAGNVACSAAAAVCLLGKQSFESAYATNPNMRTCLVKYGP